MDFFNAQRQAQRNTWILLILFVCAIAAMIAGLYLLVKVLMSTQMKEDRLSNGVLLLYTIAGTLIVIGSGTIYKISQLRAGGGRAVCELMRGTPVPLSTDDPAMRRLRNIVEEMAVAAGIAVPSLYIIEAAGVNAFAAGYSSSDAAICVTSGCLEKLTRDELQGVIAHEFSHVLNGDMRLNIRIVGVLHGILCISIAGREMLFVRGRRSGGIWAAGLGLMILGSLGALFARLIQAAVSRQREFLADASAVQFTRAPWGIGGALKKLAGLATQGRIPYSAQAHAISHMFFANALAKSFFNLFATHPPIELRIKAIDPLFKIYPRTQAVMDSEEIPQLAAGFAGGAGAAGFAGSARPVATVQADATIESIGQVTAQHMAYAQQLIRGLPREIAGAVHEPFSARAVIFALLLDRDTNLRRKQFRALQADIDSQTVQETMRLYSIVKDLDRVVHLPLVDLAIPALRSMSRPQAEAFRKATSALINADNLVSVFEFAVEKILSRHLDSVYFGKQRGKVLYRALNDVIDDCAVVMSFLTHAGHSSIEATEKAYADGMRHMRPCRAVDMLEVAHCKQERLNEALDRLASASPAIKRQTLQACAHAIASDGELVAREAELLRAIADTMDCPIPPIPFERKTASLVK